MFTLLYFQRAFAFNADYRRALRKMGFWQIISSQQTARYNICLLVHCRSIQSLNPCLFQRK